MVDTPKTSFIPKQTFRSVPGRVSHTQAHFNVPSFIGMIIFLCGMILAVGVFLYKDYSEKALVSKKQELQDIKNSFNRDDIEALRALDRRITIASSLLYGHLSPSLVFDALELRTQHDVGFTDFSYARGESGTAEVVLKGTALRFNTVGLQSKGLADTEVLASTIFSDVNVGEDGMIHFTATSQGNNALLAYAATAVVVPAQDQTLATTTEGVGSSVQDIATTTEGVNDGADDSASDTE